MTGKRIYFEVPQVLANDGRTRFRLIFDGSHNLTFQQRDGELTARYNDGLGNVNLNIVVYNATQQRWWQFRDTGSDVEFEVSPDGENWLSLGSTPTPSFINDLRIEAAAATLTNEALATEAFFDNLNTQPDCP